MSKPNRYPLPNGWYLEKYIGDDGVSHGFRIYGPNGTPLLFRSVHRRDAVAFAAAMNGVSIYEVNQMAILNNESPTQ